jgi:signal transduction histidine kinase
VADLEAVKQSIANLLSNAAKYSGDRREIVVRVDTHGAFRRVQVTDHGIGIPADQQQKIFRKFYRVESDAGTGPQGCGLGLAIVEHVIKAHGGFVQLRSEPGRGSTFTLCFPVPQGALTSDAADSGYRGRAADVARTA